MLEELGASYDVTRVQATVDPDNKASIALLLKLGFTRAGAAADELADVGFERSLP